MDGNLHAFIVVAHFFYCGTYMQLAMPSIYYSNEMSFDVRTYVYVSAFVRLVPSLSVFPCAPAFHFDLL